MSKPKLKEQIIEQAENHFTAPHRNRTPPDEEETFRARHGVQKSWSEHEFERISAIEKKTANLRKLREERDAKQHGNAT